MSFPRAAFEAATCKRFNYIINLVHNTQYKERTSGDSVGFIVFVSHGRDGLMGQTQALALLSLTHTFSA
jgi:hypothetical protein